jgi:hypothetical protein
VGQTRSKERSLCAAYSRPAAPVRGLREERPPQHIQQKKMETEPNLATQHTLFLWLRTKTNYPVSAWAVTCRNTLRRRTRPTTPTIVLWPSDPNLPSHSAVLLIQTQGSDLPNPAGPRRGCKLQSNSGFLEPARNSFRDRVLWFEKYDPQPTEAQHNP